MTVSTPTEDKGLLRKIVANQRFGVLATLNNQQPYSNLVAFAASADLRHIVFATNSNTQKYRNILSNNKVALLIDNRSNIRSDFAKGLAITALGIASEIKGDRNEKLVQLYLERHESLADFLMRQDTAVISVLVTDYILAKFDGAKRIRVDNAF